MESALALLSPCLIAVSKWLRRDRNSWKLQAARAQTGKQRWFTDYIATLQVNFSQCNGEWIGWLADLISVNAHNSKEHNIIFVVPVLFICCHRWLTPKWPCTFNNIFDFVTGTQKLHLIELICIGTYIKALRTIEIESLYRLYFYAQKSALE